MTVELERGRVLELTALAFGAPVELPIDVWNAVQVLRAESGEPVVRTVESLDSSIEGWSTRVAVTVEPCLSYTVVLLGREQVVTLDSPHGDASARVDITGAR